MTDLGVAAVEADEVGTDIVADACSYPEQKNMGAQKQWYLWNHWSEGPEFLTELSLGVP